MHKVLYFDVETTGLNPVTHDIIQLSGLIEVDGKVLHEFNYNCQPRNWESIDSKALEVVGKTIDELKNYPTAQEVFVQFENMISSSSHDWWISRYDPNDKFTPAGYNVRFDLDFLQQFFLKSGETYGTGWMQNWRMVDGLQLAYFLNFIGDLYLPNYKLATLCEHYGIEIKAHDALSDIKATRELIQIIKKRLCDD